MVELLVRLLRFLETVEPIYTSAICASHDVFLKKVLAYIYKQFAEPLTLSDIANNCGYSPQYISSRFRQRTGITIHRYLMAYRISRAKRLLLYTSKPIKEIAFQTGFKSVHHFTRVFRRIQSLPPAAWRNRPNFRDRPGVILNDDFVSIDITVRHRDTAKV
jgi:AraC-like DNA-binding protein